MSCPNTNKVNAAKKKKKILSSPDITIHDYANSKNPKTRQAKNATTPIDLNAILLNDVDELNLLESQNENNKLKKPEGPIVIDDEYNDYHIDVWYSISRFIAPEDTVRFALICKKTYAIVESPTFWFEMYKRYYKKTADLPVRLQPDCMVRLGGLRACVVKALYLMYDPFILTLNVTERRDPNALVNKQCVQCSSIQEDGMWKYIFHFRRKPEFSIQRPTENFTVLQKLRDINENPDIDSSILIVMSPNYEKLPDFIEEFPYLSSVAQHLSAGFRNYKMKMTFTNNFGTRFQSITYDPVMKYRTLNWWNSDFQNWI